MTLRVWLVKSGIKGAICPWGWIGRLHMDSTLASCEVRSAEEFVEEKYAIRDIAEIAEANQWDVEWE